VGPLSAAAAAGALEGGLAPERVRHFPAVERAVEVVPGLLEPGDTVVAKASRGVRLERLVQRLVELASTETVAEGGR
jgi:UDP-N-acetylmuramoyl-tripeptide--D-alanyl-D-alanine ligase